MLKQKREIHMKSTISFMMLAAILCVSCGTSNDSYSSSYDSNSYEQTSDYLSLQDAWDAIPLDEKVNVCTNIQDDPSIVRSTATENGIDPDVSEQFFSDVCP
jgi:hypothetical protein